MRRPEQKLHISAASFMRLALPDDIIWLHIPNGGKRSKPEAALLKAMGVLAGAPDFLVILPNGQAAFIELKAAAGKLSDAQVAFRDRAIALRCGYCTARTMEEVEEILSGWLAHWDRTLKVSLITRRAA